MYACTWYTVYVFGPHDRPSLCLSCHVEERTRAVRSLQQTVSTLTKNCCFLLHKHATSCRTAQGQHFPSPSCCPPRPTMPPLRTTTSFLLAGTALVTSWWYSQATVQAAALCSCPSSCSRHRILWITTTSTSSKRSNDATFSINILAHVASLLYTPVVTPHITFTHSKHSVANSYTSVLQQVHA